MSTALAIQSETGQGLGCAGTGEGAQAASPATLITTLTLPVPPSVNTMFRNVRGVGRVKSETYDQWQAEAGWRLKAQHPAPVHGPVMILMAVERTNSRADIDNRVKALFDLLVTHGVIEDDCLVIGFAIAWSPARDGLARIAIRPAANATVRFQLASDGAHGGWFIDAPNPEEEPA